jgi:hypothetical protein
MKYSATLLTTTCTLTITIITLIGNVSHATPVLVTGPTKCLEQKRQEQPQGVKGDVLSLSGNYMIGANRSKTKSTPVATRIWIFSGKVMPSLSALNSSAPPSTRWPLRDAQKRPNFIGWTTSDAKGKFQVGLKPGEYTLFAEYGQDLYLNLFSVDGSYSSIQVKPNKFTELQLINSENSSS